MGRMETRGNGTFVFSLTREQTLEKEFLVSQKKLLVSTLEVSVPESHLNGEDPVINAFRYTEG